MLIGSIYKTIKDYRFEGRFLLLVFLTLVVSSFDLLSLVLLSDIMAVFNGKALRDIYSTFQISSGQLVIGFGFFLFMRLISSYSLQILIISSVFDVRRKMRVSLLRRCLNLQTIAFGKKSPADIIYLVNDCTQRQVTYVLLPGLRLITDGILVSLLSIYLIMSIEANVSFIIFILFGVLFAALTLLRKYSRRLGKGDNEYGTISLNLIESSISAYRYLKIYNTIEKTISKFDHVSNELTGKRSREQAVTTITKYLLEAVLVSSILIGLYIYLNSESSAISYGPLLFYGAFRIIPLLSNIGRAQTQLQVGQHSIKLLEEFDEFMNYHFSLGSNKKNVKNPEYLDKENCIVKFDSINISFDEMAENFLFRKPLSFAIERGKTTLISGPSGTGKTTVLDLILGLLQPNSGEVVRSQEFAKALKQGNLGYISQHPFILADNLTEAITDKKWEELDAVLKNRYEFACRCACLDDLLINSRNGKRNLGKQGSFLSGGEKQRVAIARAIFFSNEFLIFDEPFSGLDQNTYERIIENLRNIKPKKTFILVSHEQEIAQEVDNLIDLSLFK